jgi:two-component system secretion sensor histidine kinase SsrA
LQGLSVLTDPFALRAVLRTLIANAAKHTASGAVTLRITGDSYAVRFAVHDSGAGVDTRVQRDLLRPGRVFDACLVRRLGHPDLGLPLSHHLAHLLGGELMLRSTPGSGSVFTLAIPAVDGFGNQLVQRLHPGFSGLGSRTLAA